MHQPPQENKMGSMPVNRLLLNMALPMILSMLIQALYNVVDSYFVAQISQDALNAVGLAFPVQNLMISVAIGTGVGVNTLLARSLGERQQERANHSAMHGILLSLASCLVFTVLGLVGSGFFYRLQTDIPGIVHHGTSYLTICCGLSAGVFVQIIFERILQATGRTFYTMITQLAGALTNLILDPIMIFGLFGFPRLEVAGAALATVCGQILAAGLAVWFNLRHNPDIHLSWKGFRLQGEVVRQIYAVGVPSIAMSSIGSIMVFGMNQILLAFTSTATAVFSIYFKLQSFFFMPVFGLNNGMVPIVAYNYGARKPERIVKTIALSVVYAVCILLVGFAVFQTVPHILLDLFRSEGEASADLLTIGVPALRTISFSFLFAGFCIVCSATFQALGHGVLSLVVSVVRQLLVLLPAAFVLSRMYGLQAIWWAWPFAEVFSLTLSALFLLRLYRKEIKPHSRLSDELSE